MKKLLVTTLLLSCMTLVGCNPITMKITASDDLSNINVEVEGFSMENITMQEDGSVNVSFDNPGTATQNQNATTGTQGVTMQNASMQTPVVQETNSHNTNEVQNTVTQETMLNAAQESTTVQDTTTQNSTAQDATIQNNVATEMTTTTENTVSTTPATDSTTNDTVETQTQSKDAYGTFKELVTNHLTAYDNIHSIELNPEAVDFSFVSSVNNDWARVDKAIVVKHSAGKVFLVIGYDEMSADYATDVYEVSGDVPTYCSTATNVRVTSYDPNEKTFGTEVTVNVLGTYWVDMVYELKDNGEFAVKGNIYTIDTSYNVEHHTLTITKELPVWMEGGDTTLQPGTKIVIDGVSTWNEMFFKIAETGEGGYITYETDAEGRVTINSVSEAEYFESLPYTG